MMEKENNKQQNDLKIRQQRQYLLSKIVDCDGLARINRIRLVNPMLADKVENTILSLLNEGRLKEGAVLPDNIVKKISYALHKEYFSPKYNIKIKK